MFFELRNGRGKLRQCLPHLRAVRDVVRGQQDAVEVLADLVERNGVHLVEQVAWRTPGARRTRRLRSSAARSLVPSIVTVAGGAFGTKSSVTTCWPVIRLALCSVARSPCLTSASTASAVVLNTCLPTPTMRSG